MDWLTETLLIHGLGNMRNRGDCMSDEHAGRLADDLTPSKTQPGARGMPFVEADTPCVQPLPGDIAVLGLREESRVGERSGIGRKKQSDG